MTQATFKQRLYLYLKHAPTRKQVPCIRRVLLAVVYEHKTLTANRSCVARRKQIMVIVKFNGLWTAAWRCMWDPSTP